MSPSPNSTVVAHSDFLGRHARVGSWQELSEGTFRTARKRLAAGDGDAAADLLEVSLQEADELRDIYERWPGEIAEWIVGRGVDIAAVEVKLDRLAALIGNKAMGGIQAEWPEYHEATMHAVRRCRVGDEDAADLIDLAHQIWLGIHDRAVDRVAGHIDIAVTLCGEDVLGDLWDFLMADWYDLHEKRFALSNQPWEVSAHQLMVAIVDGFHAHLVGGERQGDIEVIEESDRIGFRFAPCGSGGRMLDAEVTGGAPRSAAPFDFATTSRRHDWAWNEIGVCSYCVHCCLLNVVMPIDRLGFPTRVIEPPLWSGRSASTACTWWVYRDPSLIPESVYHKVGRTPQKPGGRT
ncbi:hypothetical protein [Gordonia sp. C13]|uniref:hypothetical protein n=1 Tax=Gordonia sp. C13 TaxID=2935078 RepID=UPI002009F2B0|nr:hypothetical protein [Gordonia sp. C13]MCK8613958.1 hypothetical protein [Gordonia sp. C13]